MRLDKDTIIGWLREADEARLAELWREADRVRRERVGDDVHLRGLVEISNHCVRRCGYCGIRADNRKIARYRMTSDEIMGCVREAMVFGYGTVVLQSGEDHGLTRDWIADVVRRIKGETELAVTLSLGERSDEDLEVWRAAGTDRYLLRFETSDRELYGRIHPPLPGRGSDRFAILDRLGSLGYEVGSGVMVGIPGQTYESLARDIELFRSLDLDMIGVGPFIPHPETPLGSTEPSPALLSDEQVPNTEEMTYKVVALARLVCPGSNIPSTTALATLNKAHGRELGLMRGANVVMPNLTPPRYRASYEIYPAKACIDETARTCHICMHGRIASIGRRVGRGPGGRKHAKSPS
ncbi:MAG: [FeFe] hydrogenase H-cluster radical SAM maturase HydE [Deltaproteobacteria bacterium]|nr:[FeFe] hydrogenase H-cluster radical SAM maturase HydE [Deltaproteobacteria bacterium]